MNYFKTLLVIGAVAFNVQNAGAILISSGTLNAAIPDGNPIGYLSTLHIDTGLDVANVTVTLNVTGGYAGDLYAYLTHDGYTAVLVDRIGTSELNLYGNSSAGMNVTFSSTALNNIHDLPSVGGQITGTYLPDGGNLSGFTGVGHGSTGDWTLFIADMDGGGSATLNSWSLDVTEVPEPTTWGLIGFGVIFSVTQVVRWWLARREII
jgi:subtilisin-like proprotein convertase family protein